MLHAFGSVSLKEKRSFCGFGFKWIDPCPEAEKGSLQGQSPSGSKKKKKKEKQSVVLVNFGWGWRVGVTLCQCIDNTHQ